jgi:ABC-type microcin C transport system duplicated ATPase subunit YejF
MKDGRVVESGPTERVFADPREPYTRNLMQAAFAFVGDGEVGRLAAS